VSQVSDKIIPMPRTYSNCPNRWMYCCTRNVRAGDAGFSLIEIIVSITVILILGALAFPLYQGVRAKQHTATCSSNLRQIGVTFATYQVDHNGQWPAVGRPNSTTVEWFKSEWFSYLHDDISFSDYPFDKRGMSSGVAPFNSSVLYCPAVDESSSIKPYGVNLWLWQAQYDNPVRPIALEDPSRTMLAGDKGGTQSYIMGPSAVSQSAGSSLEGRHDGHANVVYCDGHVEALSMDLFTEDLKPVTDVFWGWGVLPRP